MEQALDIQKTFARNMRKYRKEAKLTQEGLAEKSGLHRTYIGGIEQERINVSIRNVEKIAHALGVDPVQLFSPHADARGTGSGGDSGPGVASGSGSASAPASTPTPAPACVPTSFGTPSSTIAAIPAGGTAAPAFRTGDHALCSFTKEGMVLRPIEVDDANLCVRILSELIREGYRDDALVKQCRLVEEQMLRCFEALR